MEFGEASEGTRDVFSRNLDMPRGPRRERVRVNAHDYKLSGDDVRALATVGAFRVVPANELRESNPRTPTRPARDLERLRDHGLIKTMPYVVGRTRTTLVTLTERGRAVLESRRRSDAGEPVRRSTPASASPASWRTMPGSMRPTCGQPRSSPSAGLAFVAWSSRRS